MDLLHQIDVPAERMFQSLVERLVRVCQHADVAAVRLKVGRRQWTTPGFAETPWRLEAPITWRGKKLGRIEMVYLESRPMADHGPFLNGERQSLETVAACLGPHLTLRQANL